MDKRLTVIAGPTASGKTSLAIAVAQHLNGEVVSADSMQVYADLLIGTARPTVEEMAGVLHHMVGFLPLTERYSVARYAEEARGIIDRLQGEGKHPILCGGTGLYIQAVTENLTFSQEAGDETLALRRQLQEECAALGGEAMRERLAVYDPQTAKKLHPNDHGRIIRALEVVLSTGVPMSEWVRRSREIPPPYDTTMIVLDFHDRAVLYDRIDRRVDIMLEQGLLAEAEVVLQSPHAPTAMQAIGYKELAPYFHGVCPLEEAVENLKRETRRYAKRQLSWFRRIETARTLYVDEYSSAEALTAAALNMIT